jgi:hypothetical protein
MSELARALRVNLTGFVPGDVFCGKVTEPELTQRANDELQDVARRVAAPLATTLKKTRERAVAEDPALQRFIERVNTLAGRDRISEQLPWLIAHAVGRTVCKADHALTDEEASPVAVALVHFATSTEGFRSAVVAAFRQPQVSALPSATASEETALAAVKGALRKFFAAPAKLATALPAFGATVEVRGTGLGLKCAPQPQIVATNAGSVSEQGAMLAPDSRVVLKVSCTNTSPKRWTSESLVQVAVPGCAVDEGARRGDVVLPELNPGESADIVVGPLLVTDRCAESVSFEYAVRSSTVAEPQIVDIDLRMMAPRVAVRLDTVDEDTPGSSVADSNRGVGREDDFELRLSVQAPSTLETTVLKTELLGEKAKIVARAPLATMAAGPSGWAPLNDDLDVHTDAAGDEDPKDILKSDPEFRWLSTTLSMTTDCELSARVLTGTPAEAWGKVCRELSWARFLEWATKTHDLDCSLRQLQPAGTPASLPAPAAGGDLTPNAAAFVDPGYEPVAEALKSLVSAQAISASDLTVALAALDALVATPLYPGRAPAADPANRERARQILLADFAIQTRRKLSLPMPSSPAPVFAEPAATRIVGLRREFFDLLVRAQASGAQPAGNPAAAAGAALNAAAAAAGNAIGNLLGSVGVPTPAPVAAPPAEATTTGFDAATASVLMATAPRLAGLPCDKALALPTPAMPSRFETQRYVLVPREKAPDKSVELTPVRTDRKSWLELDVSVLKQIRAFVGKPVRAATADGQEIDGTLKDATEAGALIATERGASTIPWAQVLWMAALPGDV